MARRKTYQVGPYRLGKLKGQWVAVWDGEDGKRDRFRLGPIATTDGPATLQRFAREQELGKLRDVSTVDEIMTAYIAELKLFGKRSAEITEHYWKAMRPWFGHFTPEMIDKKLCKDYYDARIAAGRKVGTVLTELTRLRSALVYAEKEKLIASAPFIWRPEPPRPRDRWLTREEAQRLIDGALAFHVRLFIILALATAGRAEAILELEWDRVDFEKGLINLDNPQRDRTNKGRALVPMNDMARAALQQAKAGALTPFVIEHGGAQVKSVKKGIKAAAKRAGLDDVSPHVLRHSAAVWMAMDGVPLLEISRYLGHRSIKTTERVYLHHTPEFLKRASQSVNLSLVRKVV